MAIGDEELDQRPHLARGADNAAESEGKQRPWPRLPGHAVDLAGIRSYLNQALALPFGWSADLAERHGTYDSDPMTLLISVVGQSEPVKVRFEKASDASKPGSLRTAVFAATRGRSRMRYPKPSQASDFFAMVCALATVVEGRSAAEETLDWLSGYIEHSAPLDGLSFRPDALVDTLTFIQERAEFRRAEAQRYIRDELHADRAWISVLDAQTGELYLRAREFATYLRHVLGERNVGQRALDARIDEAGGARQTVTVDQRGRAGLEGQRVGMHISLVFYVFPSDQAFPSPLRVCTP